jgi:aspartokinase
MVSYTITLAPGCTLSPFIAALECLWENHESPLSIQQRWENGDTYRITVLCEDNTVASLSAALRQQCKALSCDFSAGPALHHLAAISVIGSGFRQSKELMAKAVRAVESRIVYHDQQDNCLTLVVVEDKLAAEIQRLHAVLVEEK